MHPWAWGLCIERGMTPSEETAIFVRLILYVVRIVRAVVSTFLGLLVKGPVDVLGIVPVRKGRTRIFFHDFGPDL